MDVDASASLPPVASGPQPADQELDGLASEVLPGRDGDAPSPKNDAALSLSPSSSTSFNLTAIDGRRASNQSLAAAADTHNALSNVPMQHTQSPTRTAHTAPQHECPSISMPAAEPSTTQADPDQGFAVADSVPFHPSTEEGGFEMAETGIPMDMALDMDLPVSERINERDATQSQRNHYNPAPSDAQDQDLTRFFFSPMPTFDIDLSAFAFSPRLNQPAEVHLDVPISHITDDITLPLSTENVQYFPNLNNLPSQIFNHASAPDKSTTSPETPKSYSTHSTNYDLPLLRENRQSHSTIVLDNAAYESLRRNVAQFLTLPVADVELPPAKVCQGFLSGYVTSFHGHLPIIHLQSVCPRTTPSPLILAMCSIGALYRLDRRRARQLYNVAIRSLNNVGQQVI